MGDESLSATVTEARDRQPGDHAGGEYAGSASSVSRDAFEPVDTDFLLA